MYWSRSRLHAKVAWPALHDAELDIIQGDRSKLIDKVREAQIMWHEAAAERVEAWRRTL